MPSTRSKGERLEQQVNEPERLISIRRRTQEHRTRYELPNPNNHIPEQVVEPEMAELPLN